MGFLTRGSKILFKTSICSGDGQIDVSNLQAAAQRQQVTDVALANYTRPDPAHTVLMLSRGMPYDGVRADLYAAGAYGRCCTLFVQQIHETILPLLQLRRENSVDLHIARSEPPLPVAAPGLIADGTVDAIRTPFSERVFFVEQDNWALPAFETGVTEALTWAQEIAKGLGPATRERR